MVAGIFIEHTERATLKRHRNCEVEISGKALLQIGTVISKDDGISPCVGGEEPPVKPTGSPMQSVSVIVTGKMVLHAVNDEPASSNPVGIPADCRAKVPCVGDVFLQAVVAQRDIPQVPLPVTDTEFLNRTTVFSHHNALSLFVKKGIGVNFIPIR